MLDYRNPQQIGNAAAKINSLLIAVSCVNGDGAPGDEYIRTNAIAWLLDMVKDLSIAIEAAAEVAEVETSS